MREVCQFLCPFFLASILISTENGEPKWIPCLYAVGLFFAVSMGSISLITQFQNESRAGFQMRSLITNEIQRKAIYITPSEKENFSSGQIFTYVASDSESLESSCRWAMSLIALPFRIIWGTAFLYAFLGWSAFVAIALLILILPIQAVTMKFGSKYIHLSMKDTDTRTKLERELISGISCHSCNLKYLKGLRWLNAMHGRIHF